jgi:hypothetical protein
MSSNYSIANHLEARKKIIAKRYRRRDIWLAVSEDLEEELLQISNLNNADSYGGPGPLREGELSRVYGVNVLVSTLVAEVTGEARSGFMFHRDSIALGFQQGADISQMFDQDYLGTRTTVDQLYGVKALQRGDTTGAASGDDVGIIKILPA